MPAKPIAIDLDPNSHGGGSLIPSQQKVFIKDLAVIRQNDLGLPDNECGEEGEPPTHCTPNAMDGSSKVFVGNIAVHLDGGIRLCGATTETINTKVFAGN